MVDFPEKREPTIAMNMMVEGDKMRDS